MDEGRWKFDPRIYIDALEGNGLLEDKPYFYVIRNPEAMEITDGKGNTVGVYEFPEHAKGQPLTVVMEAVVEVVEDVEGVRAEAKAKLQFGL